MGRRVHSRTRRFTRARIGFAGFFLVRVVSLGSIYGSPGSFVLAYVHSGARRGLRVHSGLRGFTRASRLGAGFVRVRLGSFWRASWSLGWLGFAWVHSVPLDVSGIIGVRVCSLGLAKWSPY